MKNILIVLMSIHIKKSDPFMEAKDVLFHIFAFSESKEILSLSYLSRSWLRFVRTEESVWSRIVIKIAPHWSAKAVDCQTKLRNIAKFWLNNRFRFGTLFLGMHFKGSLPSFLVRLQGLKTLQFDQYCSYEQLLIHLPDTMTTIVLPSFFPKEIGTLPPNLEVLDCSAVHQMTTFPLPPLPPTLKELRTWKFYNTPLTGLPIGVERLVVSQGYNHPLDNLPLQLRSLTLEDYMLPLDNLPPLLEHLNVGRSFNHTLVNVPPTLKTFMAGSKFNQSIDHFPDTVMEIVLGEHFNQLVKKLPLKLEKLIFCFSQYNLPLPAILPPGLKFIKISRPYNHPFTMFPDSLVELYLDGSQYNHPLPAILPHTLRKIRLGEAFNHPLPQLPPKLRSLIIMSLKFNHPLPELPDTLRELYVHGAFNQPLPTLPLSLRSLWLSYSYNHPLPVLSANMQYLCVGLHFNQPVLHMTGRLDELSWNSNSPLPTMNIAPRRVFLGYCHELPIDSVPEGVEELEIVRKDPVLRVPSTLTKLILPRDHDGSESALERSTRYYYDEQVEEEEEEEYKDPYEHILTDKLKIYMYKKEQTHPVLIRCGLPTNSME
jgi:hypothetical protein